MLEIVMVVLVVSVFAGMIWLIVRSSKGGNQNLVGELELVKKERDELFTEKRVLEERNRELIERIQKIDFEIKERDKTILEFTRELTANQTLLQQSNEKLQEQKSEIENLQEKFRIEFKNLANEILEEKSQKFTEQNRVNLSEILKPLGDKLREFEKKVDDTYDKESKERFSLVKEIGKLADLNQKISQDAQNLTTALKSDSKKQGNWGELVLERVLESSGLVKGQEYLREVATKSESGDYRPDVIVKLPDNKHIIIDAKVSLVAYNEFVNSEDQLDKDRFLKLHVTSIKNHVKLLGEKSYHNLDSFDTPDYVLLFIPIESSFSAALQADYELFNFAWERNVVIVSPTTLLATLRTVASIWKHEKQEMNAKEIARQGGDLYEKFVSFLSDLEDIGTKLSATQKSFDNSMNKLSTGKGNLIRRAEKLKELGLKPAKSIPRQLTDKAEEE